MKRSTSPFERYGSANPNTDANLQLHTFIATDSLSSIAQKYYGDLQLWRLIAERNNIADVRNIEVGTVLIIPKRPHAKGIYEAE
jgi:nucleoid-associated protein YgaU